MKIILKNNVLVEYVEFKMLKTEKKELRKKLRSFILTFRAAYYKRNNVEKEFYKIVTERYKMEGKEIH